MRSSMNCRLFRAPPLGRRLRLSRLPVRESVLLRERRPKRYFEWDCHSPQLVAAVLVRSKNIAIDPSEGHFDRRRDETMTGYLQFLGAVQKHPVLTLGAAPTYLPAVKPESKDSTARILTPSWVPQGDAGRRGRALCHDDAVRRFIAVQPASPFSNPSEWCAFV
jgi:hypothetical protein